MLVAEFAASRKRRPYMRSATTQQLTRYPAPAKRLLAIAEVMTILKEGLTMEAAKNNACVCGEGGRAGRSAELALGEVRTFADLLEYVSNTYSNEDAFAYKEGDQWRHLSTDACLSQARHLSLGLRKLGVEKGQTVGILANPSPFWLIADLAIMCMGAVSVPFFPEDPEHQLRHKFDNSDLKHLFLFNRDAWPRVQPHSRAFQAIITLGFEIDHDRAVKYEDVMRDGAAGHAAERNLFASLRETVREHDLATIIYTSGSTGAPKGVELTHGNIMSQLRGSCARFPLDARLDRALSCLPLAHSFERMIVYYYMSSGVSVYFNDDMRRLGENLREVRPTVMTVVPRILEKAREKFLGNIEAAGGLRKIIGKWAFDRAQRRTPETSIDGIARALADILVYSKFRKRMGGKLRCVITGGAAMPMNLYRSFANMGLPLYQGYGLTEAAPVLCTNYPGAHKIGTVGKPFPEVSIRVGPNGEIQAKGTNVMRGYHLLPDETARMIDSEGWLHTGDLGSVDSEGYVTITGRAKALIKTSYGEYVAPDPIEHALCASPLIDSAMIVGEGEKFVGCLLFPNFENVKRLESELGFKPGDHGEFLNSSYARDRINALLVSINNELEHWEQIRQYRFVLTPVSVETGELTPTMKLKRHVVMKKYSELIADMYK